MRFVEAQGHCMQLLERRKNGYEGYDTFRQWRA